MKKNKKILTIPNLLSFFRICLIPLFVWLYCIRQSFLWTAAVLLLSGATDIADGFIARRFQMVTALGKVLDPIADKMTQGAMLLCPLFRFPHMGLLLLALVGKEVFNGVTGAWIVWRKKQVCGTEWHGKAATFMLYGMLLIHLVWYDIPIGYSNFLIGSCIAAVMLFLLLYAIRNIKILTGKCAKEETISCNIH